MMCKQRLTMLFFRREASPSEGNVNRSAHNTVFRLLLSEGVLTNWRVFRFLRFFSFFLFLNPQRRSVDLDTVTHCTVQER